MQSKTGFRKRSDFLKRELKPKLISSGLRRFIYAMGHQKQTQNQKVSTHQNPRRVCDVVCMRKKKQQKTQSKIFTNKNRPNFYELPNRITPVCFIWEFFARRPTTTRSMINWLG